MHILQYVQCEMYSVQWSGCTYFRVCSVVSSVQCYTFDVLSLHFEVCSVQCAVCCLQCSSVQFAMYSLQCTFAVLSLQCTVYSVQYAMQCAVIGVQFTV